MTIKNLGYALVGFLIRNKEINLKLKAERDLFREAKQKRAKLNGDTLKCLESAKLAVQERCNHLKGGNSLTGIVLGKGDSNQYAVVKHRYRNGDTHIRCLRCAKTWMTGDADYSKALNFETRNVTSTDVLVASVLPDGRVTADFAEAQRKWTNARSWRGLAFSHLAEKAIVENQKEMLEAAAKVVESKIYAKNPRKPFVIGKTFNPVLYTSEFGDKMVDSNPQFTVISSNQSSVS